MTWKQITNIHKTAQEFPDKKDFLKSLYPEAFIETDISRSVTVELDKDYGPGVFLIGYKGKEVVKIWLGQTRNVSQDKSSVMVFRMEVAPGFKVSIPDSAWGIQIYRYGPDNATS